MKIKGIFYLLCTFLIIELKAQEQSYVIATDASQYFSNPDSSSTRLRTFHDESFERGFFYPPNVPYKGEEAVDYQALPDFVPSIKGDMSVNEQGAFTYTVPIEVPKTPLNTFDPHIALSYNSDAGIGQAGYGWSITGLSMITRGGKSKRIDGVYEGARFDDNDPLYLDGQRLIRVGGTNSYVTEQYSPIKIERIHTGVYDFKVQYTDGKVAYYKRPGNNDSEYYLTSIEDAYSRSIRYFYTNTGNDETIRLDFIEGPQSKIYFTYTSRQHPLKVWRNGRYKINNHLLRSIEVKKAVQNKDITYKRYVLTYDMASTQQERLRKIEIKNATGESLKPLSFSYNGANSRLEANLSSGSFDGVSAEAVSIDQQLAGDFYGNGEMNLIVREKTASNKKATYVYKEGGGKEEIANIDTGADLYSGKIIHRDGTVSTADQLIAISTVITNKTTAKLDIKAIDGASKDAFSMSVHLPPKIYRDEKIFSIPWAIYYNNPLLLGFGYRYDTIFTLWRPKLLVNDFNQDGLIDLLVYLSSGESDAEKEVYFLEIGKLLGQGKVSINIVDEGIKLANPERFKREVNEKYVIDFNGDGFVDILQLDRANKDNRQNKSATVDMFTIDFADSSLRQTMPRFELTDFNKQAPLIFGDFNGDGLTDFITPLQVYELTGNTGRSITDVINTLNNPNTKHEWNQYINIGGSFAVRRRDFTQQKLFYCASGIRDNYSGNSWWEYTFGNKPEREYSHSDYLLSKVVPMDYNHDGRTDLVGLYKTGIVSYSQNGKIKSHSVRNYTNNQTFYKPEELNRIAVFQNEYSTEGEFNLSANPNLSIPLSDKISPYTLTINSSQYDRLDAYENGLALYDLKENNKLYVKVKNDAFLERHIQWIDDGSGVTQSISYKPLKQNGVYTVRNSWSWIYPFYVHRQVPAKYIVSQIKTSYDNKSIYKSYRYENAMQHVDGLGFVGFQKRYVSDPYTSEANKKETIYTHDPMQQGRLVSTSYGKTSGEVYNRSSIEYLKKEFPNKQYLYLPKKETSEDVEKGLHTTKEYTYYANDLLQSIMTSYSNSARKESRFTYTDSWTEGNHYFYGKIASTVETTSAYGDVSSTKEEMEYTRDGALSEQKSYGNGTNAVTKSYAYDNYGNKRSESVSVGSSALTTEYDYGSLYRADSFLLTTTYPDGLKEKKMINIWGLPQREISTLGLETKREYDGWGNLVATTDPLGIKTTIRQKTLPKNRYAFISSTPGAPQEIRILDVFGREVVRKTQTLNDKWIQIRTVYDELGRKIKESEPHFEGSFIDTYFKWKAVPEYSDFQMPPFEMDVHKNETIYFKIEENGSRTQINREEMEAAMQEAIQKEKNKRRDRKSKKNKCA